MKPRMIKKKHAQEPLTLTVYPRKHRLQQAGMVFLIDWHKLQERLINTGETRSPLILYGFPSFFLVVFSPFSQGQDPPL